MPGWRCLCPELHTWRVPERTDEAKRRFTCPECKQDANVILLDSYIGSLDTGSVSLQEA